MDQKKQFQFLLYRAEAEDVSVNALVKDETIWLTQKAMAELFGIDKSGISRHIKNIFDTGELEENVVVAKIATTTQHGAISGKTQTHIVEFYNQYDKFKERTAYELTPVEIHFLENFEREQKQLMEKKKPVSN